MFPPATPPPPPPSPAQPPAAPYSRLVLNATQPANRPCRERRAQAITNAPAIVARVAHAEAEAAPLDEDCVFVVVVNGTLSNAQISAITRGLNAALVSSDGPTLAHGQVAESGVIAGIVLGVLVVALAILSGCVWWRWKPRPLRIFLSYRVFSDADLAQTLFERLTEEGIDVWCAPHSL